MVPVAVKWLVQCFGIEGPGSFKIAQIGFEKLLVFVVTVVLIFESFEPFTHLFDLTLRMIFHRVFLFRYNR